MSGNGKMKAFVYHDVNDGRFVERDIPTILDPRDAIVKVQLSTICTSDFHVLHGLCPPPTRASSWAMSS